MTLAQRAGRLLRALGSLLSAWLMLELGEEGVLLVVLFLSISLIALGIRNLVFYFTMARHMVDGRQNLYIGVIVLDFGIFSLSISQNYGLYVVVYILAAYAFSGVMGVMRALEARRYGAASWRLNLAEGVVMLAFAGAAVVFGLFRGNMAVLTRIYAAGLIYSAVLQIITAFRKTAIVYIQ